MSFRRPFSDSPPPRHPSATPKPAEQAEVIRLHTFASMRFTEIAETLELPASTVKSRFHYGIERLKTLL